MTMNHPKTVAGLLMDCCLLPTAVYVHATFVIPQKPASPVLAGDGPP